MTNYSYYGRFKIADSRVFAKGLDKTTFRSMWAFPQKPKNWQKVNCQFEKVGAEDIIIDIDAEDLNEALVTMQVTVDYLIDNYNLKCNVWYSGKKGFHIVIPFNKCIELHTFEITLKNNKKALIVGAYESLLDELSEAVKTDEYDYTLKQVTRIVQQGNKHKDKTEKERGYKICIGENNDIETDLGKIKEHSKKNENIYEPNQDIGDEQDKFIKHLEILDAGYSIDNETQGTVETLETITAGFSINPLVEKLFIINNKKDRHEIIGLIGFCCVGYLNKEQAQGILIELEANTLINETSNLAGSFWDAYNNGSNGLGALYNKLELKTDLKDNLEKQDRYTLFFEFKLYLESCRSINAEDGYLKILNIYDNDPIRVFDNKLKMYLANSENLFKIIIHYLGAKLKKVKRIIILNGGSKSGKSKLKDQLEAMTPGILNYGRSSVAFVMGMEDQYIYDGEVIYGGDKGLTVEDQTNFEAIVGFFSELVTDSYIFRGTMPNNKARECEFYSDGIMFFITEPYTNLSTFKASDQVKSRTSYITVNALTNQQSDQIIKNKHEFGKDCDKEFEQLHQNYIASIINNPLDIKISLEIDLLINKYADHDLRMHDYLLGLFEVYCQYLKILEPGEADLEKFLEIFLDKHKVTDIEYMVYEMLYRNLKPLTEKEFYDKLKDGWNTKTDMLNQRANRKTKSFFTVKQVKTYFKTEFKRNKHLKDIIESTGDILNNLFYAGLLDRLETPSNQENIYYIPHNKELEEE